MTEVRREAKGWIPRAMLMRALIPGLFSAVSLALSNIADALTVGIRVGETGLAAIGLVTPIYLVYNVISISFASGGGVTHARLTAEGHENLALAHFRRMVLWVLGIGFAILMAGLLIPNTILKLLAAGEDYPALWRMCIMYGRPLLAAAPVIMLNFLLYYFVENDDHPRLAAMAFTVSGILDLSLNILLVLILDLGVRGAIWATLVAQTVSVIILFSHFFSHRGILRLRAIVSVRAKNRREVRETVFASFRNGFSYSISYAFQFAAQLLLNHLLMNAGRRGLISGDLYVAVFDLVMNISYIVLPVYTAVGDAMQPSAATFSVERDRESLRIIRKLSLRYGLTAGMLLAAVLAVAARPVCALFGLMYTQQTEVAIPALRIYLLSTPFTGSLLILCRYHQVLRRPLLSFLNTFLREGALLIPFTLVMWLIRPEGVWWAYPLAGLCATGLFALLERRTRWLGKEWQYPMCRAVLTNSNRELSGVMDIITDFCEKQEIPMGKAVQLQLAVEELCSVTMQQAFSGKKDEYIQITLVQEPGPRYVLHIRDSAPYFNPLDLRMDKARKDMESSIMDSIGVMMVRKKSKKMVYRNFQGFNTITVIYE